MTARAMTVRATAATASTVLTTPTASTTSTATTDVLQAAKRQLDALHATHRHERALETQRELERRSEMSAVLAGTPRFPTTMAAVLALDKNTTDLTTRHDLERDMDWQHERERQRELAAATKRFESAREAYEECELSMEDKREQLDDATDTENSGSELCFDDDLRSDSEEGESDLASTATTGNDKDNSGAFSDYNDILDNEFDGFNFSNSNSFSDGSCTSDAVPSLTYESLFDQHLRALYAGEDVDGLAFFEEHSYLDAVPVDETVSGTVVEVEVESDVEFWASASISAKSSSRSASAISSTKSTNTSLDATAPSDSPLVGEAPFDRHLRAIYSGEVDDGLAFFESHGYYDIDEDTNTVGLFRSLLGLNTSAGFWGDSGSDRQRSDLSGLSGLSDSKDEEKGDEEVEVVLEEETDQHDTPGSEATDCDCDFNCGFYSDSNSDNNNRNINVSIRSVHSGAGVIDNELAFDAPLAPSRVGMDEPLFVPKDFGIVQDEIVRDAIVQDASPLPTARRTIVTFAKRSVPILAELFERGAADAILARRRGMLLPFGASAGANTSADRVHVPSSGDETSGAKSAPADETATSVAGEIPDEETIDITAPSPEINTAATAIQRTSQASERSETSERSEEIAASEETSVKSATVPIDHFFCADTCASEIDATPTVLTSYPDDTIFVDGVVARLRSRLSADELAEIDACTSDPVATHDLTFVDGVVARLRNRLAAMVYLQGELATYLPELCVDTVEPTAAEPEDAEPEDAEPEDAEPEDAQLEDGKVDAAADTAALTLTLAGSVRPTSQVVPTSEVDNPSADADDEGYHVQLVITEILEAVVDAVVIEAETSGGGVLVVSSSVVPGCAVDGESDNMDACEEQEEEEPEQQQQQDTLRVELIVGEILQAAVDAVILKVATPSVDLVPDEDMEGDSTGSATTEIPDTSSTTAASMSTTSTIATMSNPTLETVSPTTGAPTMDSSTTTTTSNSSNSSNSSNNNNNNNNNNTKKLKRTAACERRRPAWTPPTADARYMRYAETEQYQAGRMAAKERRARAEQQLKAKSQVKTRRPATASVVPVDRIGRSNVGSGSATTNNSYNNNNNNNNNNNKPPTVAPQRATAFEHSSRFKSQREANLKRIQGLRDASESTKTSRFR